MDKGQYLKSIKEKNQQGVVLFKKKRHFFIPCKGKRPEKGFGFDINKNYKLQTYRQMDEILQSNQYAIRTGYNPFLNLSLNVMDIDDKELYYQVLPLFFETFNLKNQKDLFVVQSRRGYHIYFYTSLNFSSDKAQNIDFKGHNSYIIGVGSFYEDGKSTYNLLNENPTIPLFPSEKIKTLKYSIGFRNTKFFIYGNGNYFKSDYDIDYKNNPSKTKKETSSPLIESYRKKGYKNIPHRIFQSHILGNTIQRFRSNKDGELVTFLISIGYKKKGIKKIYEKYSQKGSKYLEKEKYQKGYGNKYIDILYSHSLSYIRNLMGENEKLVHRIIACKETLISRISSYFDHLGSSKNQKNHYIHCYYFSFCIKTLEMNLKVTDKNLWFSLNEMEKITGITRKTLKKKITPLIGDYLEVIGVNKYKKPLYGVKRHILTSILSINFNQYHMKDSELIHLNLGAIGFKILKSLDHKKKWYNKREIMNKSDIKYETFEKYKLKLIQKNFIIERKGYLSKII